MRIAFTGPVEDRKGGELVLAQIEARTPLGEDLGCHHDAGAFESEGFPANVAQAGVLGEVFEGRGARALHRVISLEGPTDGELVEPVLGGRVHSRATNVVYHLENHPLTGDSEGLDPVPFQRRDDDTPEVLERRLEALGYPEWAEHCAV